jgi:nicotinamidase/pyrazinamidase
VKATALDACKLGFRTYVITDAVAAVNLNPGDDKKALEEISSQGCILVNSNEI